MKFEDALIEAINIEKKKEQEIDNMTLSNIENKTLKKMSIIWNLIAIALKEKKLDDLVYIDNNNNIHSLPLSDDTEKDDDKVKGKGKSKKDKNGKKPSDNKAAGVGEDGEEEEKEITTTE